MTEKPLTRRRWRTIGGAAAGCVLGCVLAVTTAAAAPHGAPAASGGFIAGSWYLALDAGPFAPGLEGTFLSGLAHFHDDGTFLFSDAGDFAAQSFLATFATAQYGAWRSTADPRVIEGTALHLDADGQTGEVLGWNKLQIEIRLVDRDHMAGVINVFYLPCDMASPLPSPLTCPDPVADGEAFQPASPPDVPIQFTRIPIGGAK